MAYNAGTIYYTVEAETQKLLDSSNDVNTALKQTGSEMKKLDAQSATLNTSFSKLATVIKTVIAAAALRQAADMVQSYQEMSERIQMATSSTEEFDEVQKRLLQTSNRTYRRLAEAQELYILTADSLRSMGYSTKQAMDVQDSMSYAFVKNATSVERADTAISAFTKSVNTGKVAADQWETIVSSIPSVIDDIAEASGKASAEIRLLGSSGKLTANQLTEGLRKSLDENSKAAEGMGNNLADAGVRVENALTSMLVKFESSTGFIHSFTEGIIKAADYVIDFSEDAEGMASVIKSIEVAGVSLAAVVAGRLIASMAAYTDEQTKSIATTISKNNADKLAAQGALRRTAVEKQLAMAVLATAKADLDAAKVGTYAHTVATKNLTSARTAAIAATQAHAIAQTNMNRVATIGTVAITGLKSAMAFLGGPAGLVLLAASAIYTFSSATEEAKTPTDLLSESIDKLGAATLALRKVQLEDSIGDMDKIGGDISKATVRVEYLNKQLQEFPNSKKAEEWNREILELGAQVETDSAKLKSYKDRLAAVNYELEKRKNGTTETKNNDPDLIDPSKVSDGEKAIIKLTESIKLAKLEGRDLAKATSFSGLNAEEVSKYGAQIRELSGDLFDLDQATENKDSIKDLEKNLKLAALSGMELAQAQAVLDLNEYATPDQIESVKKLSAEIYKLKQTEKFGEDPNKKIIGNVTPLTGGEFDNQEARYKAEEDKENQRYADQQKRLKEAKEAEIQVKGGYQSLEADMAQQHEDRLSQIQTAATDARLKEQEEAAKAQLAVYSTVLNSAQALTSGIMDTMDEQSTGYKVLFAAQKAFAFAQAIVSAELAAAEILAHDAGIMGMGAVATSNIVRGLGYASAGVIAGTAIAGGRQYGGPVSSNGMYRINENGAPEVFNAANGQQYMLPNTRGEVVSNKDASGGGSVNIVVNVASDGSATTNGGSQMAQLGKEIGDFVAVKFKQLEANSMRPGGALWNAKQKGR